MNIKNNKRSHDSINAITVAFIEMLKEKNMEKISVQDICRAAEINRTTFYAHYTDIYNLAEKIKEEMSGHVKEIFMQVDKLSPVSQPSLKECFVKVFQYIKDNKDFYIAYFSSHSAISALDITVKEPFKSIIGEVGKTYGFRSAQELEYHMAFFNAGLGEIIKVWLRNDCWETPQDMAIVISKEYRMENLQK